jgi:alkaline phosphatase
MLKKWSKKVLSLGLSLAVLSAGLIISTKGATEEVFATVTAATRTGGVSTPKYVFLFIGDGMSYPQIQAASYYLGALKQGSNPAVLKGGETLSFMNFPVAGSATTFDSTSFCPDSASTATSIATGYKTHSGVINMDENKSISYDTIAEKLKEQLDYKIGVVSSVNLNHATPAAFYAHQPSRGNYYEIGEELVASDFDYFAGGALLSPQGSTGDKENLYDLAKASGYTVIFDQAGASSLKKEDGKAIVIAETLADSQSISYEIDRKPGEWALSNYVKKGIEVLENEKGFFMMVESGKIDWACHANDAGATIHDTLAFDQAIKEAIAFYHKYPQDTLIIVTGDHETGGMTIGYAGTNYDTYLDQLKSQKISYAKYTDEYVKKYKADKTPFETVLKDIKENFGLMVATDANASTNQNLTLTAYEYELLKKAYEKTLSGQSYKEYTQAEYVLYGSYDPLTVTITHILNNKSGIGFTSYSHTGIPVGVFAQGQGSDLFKGYYDNTQIYFNLAQLLGIK